MNQKPTQNLTPGSSRELQGQQHVDNKAAIPERRKNQMKWCQDQRLKLQKEYDDLIKARDSLDELHSELVKESQWVMKMKEAIMKQMTPGECDGPIPPGFFQRFYSAFSNKMPPKNTSHNNDADADDEDKGDDGESEGLIDVDG